jgi:hypothetical protein
VLVDGESKGGALGEDQAIEHAQFSMPTMDAPTREAANRTKNEMTAVKRVVSPDGLVVIVSVVLLVCCNRALVPDARLREVFYANPEDFRKLASMSQQDHAIIRIRSDLTLMQTESGVKENVGLSVDRWQEYRVLFKKLGVSEGLARDESYPSAVLFYAHCEGSAIDADCKGFAYSVKPLSPTATSLDSPSEGYVFEQLSPDWYLFRWVD